MSGFDKFKERLCNKEKFYSSLTDNINDKKYEQVLKFLNRFEKETIKCYPNLYLKCNVL